MDNNIESSLDGLDQGPPDSEGIFRYVSCIRVEGRHVLPPLITNERRQEIAAWRRAAIARELKRYSRRPSSCSSDGINQVLQTQHSTPSRPASLNLQKRSPATPVNNWVRQGTIEHHLAAESDSDVERKDWHTVQADFNGIPLKRERLSGPGSSQDTPETLTGSPKNEGLLRQNSFTLPAPGPALLNYLAQEQERAQSGRRTWNLRSARDAWCTQRSLPSEPDQDSDELSDYTEGSHATQVPCVDDVPLSASGHGISVPSVVKEEMNSLAAMMVSLKTKHDQQRLALEEEQREEKEKYEVMCRRKISDLLGLKKSASVSGEALLGDQDWSAGDRSNGAALRSVRSAGDARTALRPPHPAENGRPQSADTFGSVTDIELSLREDSYVSKVPKREDQLETCSLSSHASTLSNASTTNRTINKYRQATHADLERYNKAASKICAAVRGYFVRRLMRTEHVKDIFRSFRDTIHMANKIKSAKDLQASDVNFLFGLTRQISSDWNAIYEIFHGTSISDQMKLIATDRKLRSARIRSPQSQDSSGRMISSATRKSLSRKQNAMSRSLTGFPRSSSFSRSCFNMSSSLSGALPSPKP